MIRIGINNFNKHAKIHTGRVHPLCLLKIIHQKFTKLIQKAASSRILLRELINTKAAEIDCTDKIKVKSEH